MYVITFSNRCVCPTGFRKIGSSGSDECEDIDECFHNPDICGEGGECRNTQGSWLTLNDFHFWIFNANLVTFRIILALNLSLF